MSEVSPEDAASIRIQFTESSWPTSLPHPEEEYFFSVVCGNTHLHWAMHNNIRKHYSPATCWITRSIASIAIPDHDRLMPFLPKAAIDLFRPDGGSVPSSREAIVHYMNSKRIPFVTVYLISTNPTNEAKLAALFEGLCCRLIRLKATDFSNPLPYNTIGIDRLANGKGVGNVDNRPVMVIDGGTAMTITFLDHQGQILNGSITLGLGAKFRALHEETGKLPHITPDEMKLAWKNRVAHEGDDDDDDDDDGMPQNDGDERPRPLTAFAENTREAIMAGVVKEVALFLNTMASDWIDRLDENKDSRVRGDEKKKPAPLVVVTGSDGPILADLMSPDRCRYIIDMNPKHFVNVEVKHIKFLAHRGIAQVLLEQKENLDSQLEHTDHGTDHQNLRNELIGQRVAKSFFGATNKLTGDSTFYGVIAAVTSGRDIFDDDIFTVNYDDNDSEDMEVLEVYKALKLYAEKGEPYSTTFNMKPKIEGARQGTKLLETFSELIKSSEQLGSPPRKRIRPAQSEEVPLSASDSNDDTSLGNDRKPVARPGNELPAFENASDDEPEAAPLDEPDDGSNSNASDISDYEAVPNVSGDETGEEGPAGDEERGADAARGGAIDDFVGLRIAKHFGDTVFCGTIKEKRGGDLWFVLYDDDDEEEFDKDEVLKYSKLFKELYP